MGNIQEKKQSNPYRTITKVMTLAALLAVPALPGVPREAAAVTAITCSGGVTTGCHFNTTVTDGTGRNVPAGLFPGSHGKHAGSAAGQYGYACTKCHGKAGTYANSHQDGFVNISSVQVPGNAYNQGKKIAYGNSFTMGACTNAACHSTVQGANGTGTGIYQSSPTWGTSGTLNCGSCHANMSGASGTGSHIKHAGSTGYSMACSNCHTGYTSTTPNYANHGNGTIEVAPPTGSYTGGTTNGNHAPGGGYGTCGSVSCHSDGKATPTYTTPTWGTAASGACGTCHRVQNTYANMALAGTPPALSAAHYKHLASDRYGLNSAFNCGTCHATTASNNTTVLLAGGKHANGTRDYKFGSFGGADQSAGTYAGSCTAIYCHSKGRSTTAPFTAPMTTIAWTAGAGAATCVTCHGSNDTAANVTANGPFDKHPTHIGTDKYNFTCDQCHAETVAAGSSTALNASTGYTKHVNGAKDYKFSATVRGTAYSNAAGTYAGSGGACANIYCHSAGTRMTNNPTTYPYTGTGFAPYQTPSWTGSLTNCNGCHGSASYTTGRPDYANGTPKANSHVAHASLTCDKCHYATTTDGTTIADRTRHVNAAYNVSNLNGTLTYAMGTIAANGVPAAGTCSGTFGCHGAATWGGPSMTCVSCHSAAVGSRRQVTATGTQADGTGGTTGGDFVRLSRHVANGTSTQIVTKWDCIVCHMEGDASTGGTSAYHHGASDVNSYINLRNVDSPSTGWTLNKSAMDETQRTNLDNFCLACHDSDGAKGISVNASNSGLNYNTTGGTVARNTTPWNTNDGVSKSGAGTATATNGRDGLNGRTRVVDVKTQFNPGTLTGANYDGNPSQHAVLGARYSTNNASWTSVAWTAHTLRNGTVMNTIREKARLHCSDCHLNETNAHGAANAFYMLLNGTPGDYTSDTAMAGVGYTSSAITCYKCHNPSVYDGTATNGASRTDHKMDGHANGALYASTNGPKLGAPCLNCHGGDGYGNIHGVSGSYSPPSSGKTFTRYRFLPGAYMQYAPGTTGDADFAASGTGSCYTPGSSWSGCTSHASSTRAAGTQSTTYGRAVKY